MDDNFELWGSSADDEGVSSDESTTAGKNNEDNKGMSAEVSSSFSGQNLELRLGLSGQHARSFTNKDFPSSSSIKNPNSFSAVGWPPLRRANRLAFHTKSLEEQSSSTSEPNRDSKHDAREVVFENGYQPVKVNMNGTLYGRKVDLNAHNSYEVLAQTLEDMFFENRSSAEAVGPSKLLDATSQFVLTYEDKDGDWKLAGDIPWQMFLRSVRRLRIMRSSDSVRIGGRKRSIACATCQYKKIRTGI